MVIIVGSAVAAFLFVYAFFSYKSRKLPPSPPWAFPIIGHILYLLGKQPHHSLSSLARKYGGLMYLRLGSVDTLVISTPAAAKEVLKTQDQNFCSRPASSTADYIFYHGNDLAFAPYGDDWRNLRKLCTLEVFTNKRVEMFQPLRRLEMFALMKNLLEASEQKVVLSMTAAVFDVTFNLMTRLVMNKSFSGACKDEDEKKMALEFMETMHEFYPVGGGTNIGDFIPFLRLLDPQVHKLKSVSARMDKFFNRVLKEHKLNFESGKVAEDFIDVMLATGALTDVTIKALATDMMIAGFDTTAQTVDWTMAELIKNPRIMQRVQRELDDVVGKERLANEADIPKLEFLQAIVKETLRLHPVAPMLLPRETLAACKFWGYDIPAKTRVIVNAYALGRDEEVWAEPLKFDPERFLGNGVDMKGQHYELVPFGSGRRMCPGMNLGLTMAYYMLGTLLHAFDWHLPESRKPEDVDMNEIFGIAMGRATPLMLTPSKRLPLQAYNNVCVENV